MYDPSIPYLFEESNHFERELQRRDDFKVDWQLMCSTCEYLVQDRDRFERFGLILLKYIISLEFKFNTANKLKLIDVYYLPHVNTDKEKRAQTKRVRHEETALQQSESGNDDHFSTRFRQVIFSYCLKIRDTQQELFHAEVYQLLYSILDQCASYIAITTWKTEVDSSTLQKERNIVRACDDLIDSYILFPNSYPRDFHIKDYCKELTYDKEVEKTISIRIALFNALYGSELTPIPLENQFEFSETWISFLQQIHESPATKLFTLHAESIECDLNMHAKRTEDGLHVVPSEKGESGLISFCFTNQQEYENVLKECIQSLRHAHTRYITTLVYALYQLTLYIHTDDTSLDAQRLGQTMLIMEQPTLWCGLYESILTSLALESKPFRESPYLYKLIKTAACHVRFRYLTNSAQQLQKENDRALLKRVWDHFYLQRSIFLKSFNKENDRRLAEEKQAEIEWIERIIFTSAWSVFPN